MRQKIFILSLLLLAVGSARTQDTVRYGDSNYYFMPYDTVHNLHHSHWSWANFPDNTRYFGNYVDSPLTVYGLAVLSPGKPNYKIFYDHYNYQMPDTSSIHLDLYAMLLMKEGDSYYHVDSVKWYPRNPNRYFKFERIHQDSYGEIRIIDTVVPVYEFYFKTPQVVVDTFAVGQFSNLAYFDRQGDFMGYSYGDCGAFVNVRIDFDVLFGGVMQGGQFQLVEVIDTPSQFVGDSSERDNNMTRDTHFYLEYMGSNLFGGIFPIIVPPDTDSYECPRVENFRLADYVDGRPLFNWNRLGGQQPFQVAYGPADQDLDSFRVVAASVPPYLLPVWDLDSTVVYAARCRGRCHHTCPIHDTIVWSEWSDTVQFCTGSRHTEGIEPTEEGRTVFVLRPNPTRSRVTVEAECAIRIVEVADMAGRVLMSERYDTDTRSATLDVGRLAQGSYLVRVKTEREEGVQKLIIE